MTHDAAPDPLSARAGVRAPRAGREVASAQDAREGHLMVGVLFAFYLFDAALLGAYALLGRLPLAWPLACAATGAITACVLLWLARQYGPDKLNSPASVVCQGSVALCMFLAIAWHHPAVGMAMILTAMSVIASSALRMPPVGMAAIILASTGGMVALFLRPDALPALPMQGRAEQWVSGLFIAWSLIKTASLNAIGAKMREELDRSHAALTQALGEVERLASTDELTGLPNRRAILRQLAALRERTSAEGAPMGLAILDIDHFKRINDRHGHPTGDAVLREAGAALRQGLRGGDLVGRVGGEEFVLLMPGLSQEDALQRVGERTRASIERQPWARIHDGLQVTVSIGMTMGLPGEPVDDWLARADRALYHAKTLGRNRVALELADKSTPTESTPTARPATPAALAPSAV